MAIACRLSFIVSSTNQYLVASATLLRNWIEPARTPRIAAEEPCGSEPAAVHDTMTFQRFDRVRGASRMEPTAVAEERRYPPLVPPKRYREYVARSPHRSIVPHGYSRGGRKLQRLGPLMLSRKYRVSERAPRSVHCEDWRNIPVSIQEPDECARSSRTRHAELRSWGGRALMPLTRCAAFWRFGAWSRGRAVAQPKTSLPPSGAQLPRYRTQLRSRAARAVVLREFVA